MVGIWIADRAANDWSREQVVVEEDKGGNFRIGNTLVFPSMIHFVHSKSTPKPNGCAWKLELDLI